MAGRLAGKKIFVTGAAQGLGAAMAKGAAAEGAKVAITDVNAAGAESVTGEINAAYGAKTAFAYALDVTNEEQWIAALERANADMVGISGLVNNAGISSREGGIEELSLEGFRRLMSVNVDSVFLGAKHGIKYLAKNQPGSIVNISSIAGLIANHTSPGYNASK
ncbi:MAG: SDR family NAD(P)-dependent oxidoreductase, partial [Caulobacteraceae bacterium]